MFDAKAVDALIRRKVLEDIYDRMTDEEKRLFIQMTMMNKNHQDIMAALQQQSKQIEELHRRQQTFTEDFASNIAGNALWSGVTWLFSKLRVKL